jgi:hypothetical protein
MARLITIFILLVCSISIYGQNFEYKASIDSIEHIGFYKILLSPIINSTLNENFDDIRIFDKQHAEIPYILYKEKPLNEKELFVEYEIIEIEHIKKHRYTRLVIRNPKKTSISNIVLRIKNADVRKRLKLNASYDNKTWFVLKDNYYYNSIKGENNNSEIRILKFPKSDYEYYELLIDDYYDKPINIIQAGYYNTFNENGKFTTLKNIDWVRKDSLKETLITIVSKSHYIDKIALNITAPKYYHREALILLKQVNSKNKKGIKTINSFTLESNNSNSIIIDNIKEDTLFIRIKNNDNEGLTIESISFYQLNKYLVAELNSSNTYHLLLSDEKADKPIYDLHYFKDSIPDYLQIINTHSIEKLDIKEIGKDENFSISKYWLWISIILIALLLSYMSIKMLKEEK